MFVMFVLIVTHSKQDLKQTVEPQIIYVFSILLNIAVYIKG